MKKLYFLVCLSFLALQCYSQNIQNLSNSLATEFVENHETAINQSRGGDQPFWSSDFSDDSVWEAETVLGNYNWEISTNEGGWFFANGQINSDSGNEFAFVWNGDPTDATETLLQAEYDLTTANPIDVSTIESAVLEFQLYGARFTDSLKVQVSSDGTNFTTVGNHQDIGQLTAGGGSVTANPLLRSYNITLDVQGEDELWIRFKFQSAASGIAYGWFIDDVNIVIPQPYDLAIGDVYTGDIINDYEYTMTPLEQAHTLNLGGVMTNLGGEEAVDAVLHAEVFVDGSTDPVYTGDSDPITLVQGESELVWIYSDFTPAVTGDYTVEYEVMQTEMDAIPEDNTSSKPFMITDYTWANDDYNAINTDFDGALGNVLAEDEWILGTSFTVFEPGTEFQAAAVSLLAEEGTEMAMTLWLLGDDIEFIASTDYEATEDDANVFSNDLTIIEMDDQVELQVGSTYIIGLQHFPGEAAVTVDCSTFDNDFSTFIFGGYGTGGATDWFVFDDISPVIRLLSSDIDSVDELNEEKLTVGQNFPNPVSGETTIPFSLEKPSNIEVRILDVTGKLVYSNDFGVFNNGYNEIQISDLDLTSGIYTYQVISNTFTANKTLLSN